MILAADWTVGSVLLTMFMFFLFILWIWILVDVLFDVFRRSDLAGWVKALWVVGVLLFPLLGVLVYLLIRGPKMHEETRRQFKRALVDHERASRQVEVNASEEIARAKQLLDDGTITQEEFDRLKDKALAR